ncbi:hypothetical protein BS78_02G140300 [Paspalum vaginatum]|nr:hypothetical protein BS78_02G140300 [Paspalum vaginatum]
MLPLLPLSSSQSSNYDRSPDSARLTGSKGRWCLSSLHSMRRRRRLSLPRRICLRPPNSKEASAASRRLQRTRWCRLRQRQIGLGRRPLRLPMAFPARPIPLPPLPTDAPPARPLPKSCSSSTTTARAPASSTSLSRSRRSRSAAAFPCVGALWRLSLAGGGRAHVAFGDARLSVQVNVAAARGSTASGRRPRR